MRNIFHIFIATLFFAPLAFGSVEAWSLGIIECIAPAALCGLLFWARKHDEVRIYQTPGIVPLTCFVVYILLQVLPLPAEFVRLISPGSYAVYAGSAGATGQLTWIPISVHPKATVGELLRFSSYAAFYMLTVQLLAQKKYLKQTVLAITIFGAVLAIFSIFQGFTSNGKIYWLREVATKLYYGPFVNRNHFAGFMIMLFPLAAGLFLALKPSVAYGSFKSRLSDMLTQKQLNNYILAGILAVFIAASVFLSLSRSGIFSLVCSMAFMCVLLLLITGSRKTALAMIGISLLSVLIVGWFGWGQVISRFDDLKSSASIVRTKTIDRPDRIEMWKDTVSIINDFPATGSGIGTFASIYPKYRTHWTDYVIDHAHGDYLELLAEGGIIGFLLAAWFVISVAYSTGRVIRKRKDSYSIYIYTGCVTGLFAMLIFSLSDFNLHIGSNGLYFFFLAGLAVSAANTRLHKGLEPTYLEQRTYAATLPLRITTSILLAATLIINAGTATGYYFYSAVKNIRPADKADAARITQLKNDAVNAAIFDPLQSRYYYSAGLLEKRLGNADAAISDLDRAVSLTPLNGEYMQKLGLGLYEKGLREQGDKLIRNGTIQDVANPAMYKFYAIHLFSTGRKELAVSAIRDGLAMAPDRAEDFILLMMLRGVDDNGILSAMPDRAAAHLAFAAYLSNSRKQDAADKAYRDLLYFAVREKLPTRAFFIKAYDYFAKRELNEDALTSIKQGLSVLPNDGLLHFTAGIAYEKLGMNSAAIDAYQKAISLDIARTDAAKRMEDLIKKTGKS